MIKIKRQGIKNKGLSMNTKSVFTDRIYMLVGVYF